MDFFKKKTLEYSLGLIFSSKQLIVDKNGIKSYNECIFY